MDKKAIDLKINDLISNMDDEKCHSYLIDQITEFNNDKSDTWSPCKPTLDQEMPQLKYNACSDSYDDEQIFKSDIINFFGLKLYNEVAEAAYCYEHDI
jgi:hypothetical protein